MKVFTRDYRMNHMCSPVFGEYYGAMKPCVLDIEATGLDPSRCKVILIGLLTETESGVRVTQFLAENHYEEHKVLEAAMEFLRDENIDYIITFNGLRYDVPFINTRLENNFMDERLSLYDFDLYRFLRKCSILPSKQDSLSQSACEAYFGISGNRQDTITGRESVSMFDEYAISGNSTIEKIILTHNREDVLQLYELMKLSSANEYKDILDCDFHTAIAKYGFPGQSGELSIRPQLQASKKRLHITGDQNASPIAAAYFPDIDNPATAIFKATTASFEIDVPVESYEGECFVDIKKLGIDFEEAVNGYLILDSRNINKFSKEVIKKWR